MNINSLKEIKLYLNFFLNYIYVACKLCGFGKII